MSRTRSATTERIGEIGEFVLQAVPTFLQNLSREALIAALFQCICPGCRIPWTVMQPPLSTAVRSSNR